MFGKCVWYQLSDTHNLNNIIKLFYTRFLTSKYKAHITADYNILESEYKNTKYNLKNNYRFLKVGDPYVHSDGEFYAIQQDYNLLSDTSVSCNHLYHVSLAYKVNQTFTEEELEYIKKLNIPDFIYKKDIEIHLWDCDSIYTTDWKMLE